MPSTEVTVFQKNIRMGLNPLLQAKLGSERTQFMLFPEYFFIDQHIDDHKSSVESAEKGLNWLVELSESYRGIIIGGSVIRKTEKGLCNSTPIIQAGQIIDYYDKRNLTSEEKDVLTPGDEPGIFLLNNIRFGVLISDDLYIEEYFQQLADEDIRLVFAPFVSGKNDGETDEQRAKHDQELFAERAKKYNLTLVKCSAVGSLFSQELQGRSLVCSPAGITWRVGSSEFEEEITKRCTVVYPRTAA